MGLFELLINWRRVRKRQLLLLFALINVLPQISCAHAYIPQDATSSSSQESSIIIENRALISNPIVNSNCRVDSGLDKIFCFDLHSESLLPPKQSYFGHVSYAELENVSVSLASFGKLFPNLETLVVSRGSKTMASLQDRFWPSLRTLNISHNDLKWEELGSGFISHFPSLELLDISNNEVTSMTLNLSQAPALRYVDISGNPLDCTSQLDWLEQGSVHLLNDEDTLCDLPPHQNKAKPIWKVLRLIKKVREECRLNCTCQIAYIWEQNHDIHSKTTVNCSSKGLTDFPDPKLLPSPTDTLDLSYNEIKSIRRFVEDERYEHLEVMNLHLDSNQLDSISLLEGSDWLYNFQVFTFRNNSISQVPVYILENAFNVNKNILQVDLSLNPFNCECRTLSTLKVWLLKHSSNIKNIEDVKCIETGEQVRYLQRDDWCTAEYSDGEQLVDILDIISVFLAVAILLVISKLYYDYWNFKHKGKLPWLVRRM